MPLPILETFPGKARRSAGSSLASAVLLLALLLLPRTAAAQVLYGSLVGNVTDASGGAIASARIAIVNPTTNDSRETVTNTYGGYSFPNLPAGDYNLTVTATGFQTFVSNGVRVSINSVVRVDAALQVGTLTEQMTVSAAAAALQTDRSDMRFEVDRLNLQDLPTPIGRNFQAELRLLPGVNLSGGGAVRGSNPAASFTVNVNGAPTELNNTRIDGATAANNMIQSNAAYIPALEAIQTVEAVTNSYDAEIGLVGGAAVNVQVKTGSNQIHGSAFEYHSDNVIKARPALFPVNQGKPKMIFNQLGGTIGGPIKKDKLFYFLSYDGLLSRQSYSVYATVPTAAAKTGNLTESPTAIYDPATGNPDGTGRQPFPGNIVPTARFSAPSQKILPLWPEANLSGQANNYFASASAPYNRHTIDTKVNYNASSKLTMFARVGILIWDEYYEPVFGTSLGGVAISGQQAGPANGNTINLTGAATYVISSNLVLDGYFGYNRSYQNVLPVDLEKKVGTDFLGIPGTNGDRSFEGGWPVISLAGYNGIGMDQPYMPWIRHDPGYNYVLNFNWTKGKHNIRWGVEYSRRAMNHAQPEIEGQIGGASGGFQFTQGVTQVPGGPAANRDNTFAAFLLGLPQAMGRTLQIPDQLQLRSNFYSGYIQDRWMITPKLTMTYGVRWEYLPLPHRPDRGVEFYNRDNNTIMLCGYGSQPSDCGVSMVKDGFSPRIGLAYRATSTLVIRAGFGITRDPYDIGPRGVRTNYPIMVSYNYQGASTYIPVGNWAQGIPAITPPAYGNGIIPVPASAVVHAIPQDVHRGYIASRNFSLQKEFPHGFVAQASYVGNLVIHQFGKIDLNAGQIPGAGIAGEPLYAAFKRTATTPEYRPLGTTNYNALQATLQRRFAQGLQLGAAYTWSKAIGTVSSIEGGPAVPAQDYFYKNRSVLSYDRTQVLHVSGVWQLPFGKGKPWLNNGGFASILAGGWQVNGILTCMTGLPFTVTAANTSLNMPGNTQFADQVSKTVQMLGGTGPNSVWFDPSAYAPVTQARLGTSGLYALRGPGMINVDFGLFRDFPITERFHLQFRGEAFNFTNTPHWALPSASLANVTYNANGSIANLGGFGSITGTDASNLGRASLDERTFRFGLRLSF